MPAFPAASRKPSLPSFAAYPIGYEIIRTQLEPFLPMDPFEFCYTGISTQFAKIRDARAVTIFRLQYHPAKPREAHWSLYAYSALSQDKAAIRAAMQESGFPSLIEFLTRLRDPLWKDLAFARSIIWNSKKQKLRNKDWNQIE